MQFCVVNGFWAEATSMRHTRLCFWLKSGRDRLANYLDAATGWAIFDNVLRSLHRVGLCEDSRTIW